MLTIPYHLVHSNNASLFTHHTTHPTFLPTHTDYKIDTITKVHGARHIAQLAQECNAQLLHISAIGADSNSDIAYSRTKAIGEQAAFKECRNTTVFRPSIVFGKEDQFFNVISYNLSRYV